LFIFEEKNLAFDQFLLAVLGDSSKQFCEISKAIFKCIGPSKYGKI
jgi:hypothetical protein